MPKTHLMREDREREYAENRMVFWESVFNESVRQYLKHHGSSNVQDGIRHAIGCADDALKARDLVTTERP